MARKHAVRLEDLLPKGQKVDETKKETWVAIIPALKMKPIVHHDAKTFVMIVERIQGMFPNMTIHTYRFVRHTV